MPSSYTPATGDVFGPASATDNAVARFDTTTGKFLQNSVVTITDAGALALPYGTTADPAIEWADGSGVNAVSGGGSVDIIVANGRSFRVHTGYVVIEGSTGALYFDNGGFDTSTARMLLFHGTLEVSLASAGLKIGSTGTPFLRSTTYTAAMSASVLAGAIGTVTITATGVAAGDTFAIEIPLQTASLVLAGVRGGTDQILVDFYNADLLGAHSLSGTVKIRSFEV